MENGLDIRVGGCFRESDVTARNGSSRVQGAIAPPSVRVILGPPGCGKTTRLLGLMEAELEAGLSPARIACVTFTRAARRQVQEQVVEKLGLRLGSFPWIRTLHSTAYRLLGIHHDQILANDRWMEFCERHGYLLSGMLGASDLDGAPREMPTQTPDDIVRTAYSWGRSRGLDVDRTLALCPAEQGLSASGLRLFWRRLDAFKAEHGLYDFPDLLEAVLQRRLHPDVQVLFVDEAQDLSPQQIAVIESWFPHCDRVYVAGDEDQTIYEFQGADPTWLLDLSRRADVETLRQSYRVPAAVHAMAGGIIQQNRQRIPKEYRPRPAIGDVRFLSESAALAAVDGDRSTFVLARNRHYLRRWAQDLLNRAVPFLVEGRGGVSPLSKGRLRTAVDLALRLRQSPCEDDRINAGDLDALLTQVPASSGLVPRGVKTQVREAKRLEIVFTVSELREDLGLNSLLDAMRRAKGLELLQGIPTRFREYFEALVKRHGELPEPCVTLTSIHGAKGREADLVVVLPDLTRTTSRAMLAGTAGREAENRVFYVAVTRAREEVVLVAPRGRRHYPFPSYRFEGGQL
ncbi:MAG: hypothetical protein DRQ55_09710 [Planctomycetota bacterium]|nr:MAG: hypothetical protein DRQ55_09710 [Planctomycetota bacterium]